ncbi:MAG: toxin ParE1 [Nitrospirales bacterium]|nr:MAG: toxin ParE1 [Nitrospirales bacterium]
MIEIRKTALAKSDLEDIWLHSFQEWGEAQADTYHDHPTQVIEQLRHNPHLGKPCDHVQAGYRMVQAERHTIYYQLHDDHLMILRVLHERMDPTKHL